MRWSLLSLGGAISAERIECVQGHDNRHTLPVVARAMKLPKQVRESLANWRMTPQFGEDKMDREAYAATVRAAREVATRSTKLASSADRYGSAAAGAEVPADEAELCV